MTEENKEKNEFQVEDAITQIYSYLTIADVYIEKYLIVNKELYHLSLLLDNIKSIIYKLDKDYDILTEIIANEDKREKEVIIAEFEKQLKVESNLE